MTPNAILEPYYPSEVAESLFSEICQYATSQPTLGPGMFWALGPNGRRGPIQRDVDGGTAGIVLALSRAVKELTLEHARPVLLNSARWLKASLPLPDGPPLPGFYVGESGISAALLRCGFVLDDTELIEAALERQAAVAKLPYTSPDLYNGTAGRIRVHLAFSLACNSDDHLAFAIEAGENLLRSAERPLNGGLFWRLPAEGYGAASSKVYLGYAHGAAGVADALLDLHKASGERRFLHAAESAGRWLLSHALPSLESGKGRDWPETPGSESFGGFWCHGAAGIGRLFARLANLGSMEEAAGTAVRAALTVVYGTRWASSGQCHGLAGNGDFLLDIHKASGQDSFRETAHLFGRLALPYSRLPARALGTSLSGSNFESLDYMNGAAGLADFYLRLSSSDHLPSLLSLEGLTDFLTAPEENIKASAWPQLEDLDICEDVGFAYELCPAFNSTARIEARENVLRGNFNCLGMHSSSGDARKLLCAAADNLPEDLHRDLDTFLLHSTVKIEGESKSEPLRSEQIDGRATEAMSNLGDRLRFLEYDNTSNCGALGAFALQTPVNKIDLEHQLGRELVNELELLGLAKEVGNCHRLAIGVLRAGPVFAAVPQNRATSEEVAYLGPDSLLLLDAALRLAPAGDRAIELGAGTGLSSAVLAHRYATVVATDILQSNICVASLTFALNEITTARKCHPVAMDICAGFRQSSFDLVLANPPWVPSEIADGAVFADGGPTGFELPARFISEAANLLRPSGVAVVLTSDPLLVDGSRPLSDVCLALSDRGFLIDVMPVVSNLGGTRGVHERLVRASGLTDTRLVIVIVERVVTHSTDFSRSARAAARCLLARRLLYW